MTTPQCARCIRRSGAIAAIGMERFQGAPAVGEFRVVRNGSGLESREYLCAEDLRGLRALPALFTVTGWVTP